MTDSRHRTRLRTQVLDMLRQGPIDNVGAAATALGVHRPGLSRLLHQLVRLGWVTHAGRLWSITPAGADVTPPERCPTCDQVLPTRLTRVGPRL